MNATINLWDFSFNDAEAGATRAGHSQTSDSRFPAATDGSFHPPGNSKTSFDSFNPFWLEQRMSKGISELDSPLAG
jgi:hypothetical protein